MNTYRFVTALTKEQKACLNEVWKEGGTHRQRQRAQALLLSDQGKTIEELAAIFRVDRDTVSRWIKQWEAKGMESLSDAPRSGRPSKMEEVFQALEEIFSHPGPNLKAAIDEELKKRHPHKN